MLIWSSLPTRALLNDSFARSPSSGIWARRPTITGREILTPRRNRKQSAISSIPMSSEKEVILLAEDDQNDIALFQRAFKQAQIKNPLQIVRDGEEAIAYLEGEGKFADRGQFPLPTLLLLDLKMPRKSGFQV